MDEELAEDVSQAGKDAKIGEGIEMDIKPPDKDVSGSPETSPQDPRSSSIPANVKAMCDPENPYRQIIVTWQAPPGNRPKGYDCKLYLDSEGKHSSNAVPEMHPDGLGATFSCLKPDTLYFASVSSSLGNGRFSDEVTVHTTTHKALRKQGFDIKKLGKAIIHRCESVVRNGDVWSDVRWRLADLGHEKYHYSLAEVSATYSIKNEGLKMLPVDEDKCKAKAVKLERGKSYFITIQCSYVNLDDGANLTAETKNILNTEIEELSGLSVDCIKENIRVKWNETNGATSYTLKIFDNLDKELYVQKDIKTTEVKISMEDDKYTYGRICKFQVDAIGHVKNKSTSASERVLIGGDEAVPNVMLSKSREDPRRRVDVAWDVPKSKPTHYEVTLFEMKPVKGKVTTNIVSKKKETITSTNFETKPNTTYMCKVKPLYVNDLVGGSVSESVTREKRKDYAIENDEKFGKPNNVEHHITHDKKGAKIAKVLWDRVILSANFSFQKMTLKVTQKKGRFMGMVDKDIQTNDWDESKPKIETFPVLDDNEYDISFKIKYKNLDDGKTTDTEYIHHISTASNCSEIVGCDWKEGKITFKWKAVKDVLKYEIKIFDDTSEKVLDAKVVEKVRQEEVYSETFTVTEELRVGITCWVKVTSLLENNVSSDSQKKQYIIGGVNVPRNVRAFNRRENPQRNVKITFDAPKKGGADEYKVRACPDAGKIRKQTFSSSDGIFEYLKKDTSYAFFVSAKFGETWSVESQSNKVRTDGDRSNNPLINISGSQKTANFRESMITSTSTILPQSKGKDFGKVRELSEETTELEKCDSVVLRWKVPSFDNKPGDFMIHSFKVLVKTGMTDTKESEVKYDRNVTGYRSKEYELQLGKNYDVSVTTSYDIIDEDATITSDAYRMTIHTRPQKPRIIFNGPQNDALKIEWVLAEGASYYKVDVFHQKSKEPLFSERVNDLIWSRPFDETFGYGITYYAVLTAISIYSKDEKEKRNSITTEWITIGGDYVPTNVRATNKDVVEPRTQALVTWEAPKTKPEKYKVTSQPPMEGLTVDFNDGTSCLVTGLKGGSNYRLQVFAIHANKQEFGCFSNEITTDPRPTQVKNVRCSPGPDPSTSIHVLWDAQDRKIDEESTKYKICFKTVGVNKEEVDKREFILMDRNLEHFKQANSEETTIRFTGDGLKPGTQYTASVFGGNDKGYGRESVSVDIKTEFALPLDVALTTDEKTPWKTLILRYTSAIGHPMSHSAILYQHDDTSTREVRKETRVESGHIFDDLESNKTYSVKINAVFDDVSGKQEQSNKTLTAPSKVIFKKYDCVENLQRSSREIFLEWNVEPGATIHEIQILREDETKETQLVIMGMNEMIYFCRNEAATYRVKIRSANRSGNFGDWSDLVDVELAPAKVQSVKAQLKESGLIEVTCKNAKKPGLSYFLQAMCNGKKIGQEIRGEEKKIQELDLIKFGFSPPHPAQKYYFSVWAKNLKDKKGEDSLSESVTSKPGMLTKLDIGRGQHDPSRDIEVKWTAQERCDSYEVKYGIKNEKNLEGICMFSTNRCILRCKSPGNHYKIEVRAICGNVKGDWSNPFYSLLQPPAIELLEDDILIANPCSSVKVQWKPLAVKPDEYIATLYCNNERVDQYIGGDTTIVFQNGLKPGSKCFCEVKAQKEELIGEPVKSKLYTIEWPRIEDFEVYVDKIESSKKIFMKWGKPESVNCFKLEIEDKQNGVVVCKQLISQLYSMENATPGQSYSIRLFCGCDGKYSSKYIEKNYKNRPRPSNRNHGKSNQEK